MTGRFTRLAAALALSGAASLAFAQAPIKIGFVAELSGPQGALGQDQYDAFMMVVERNGGKLGGVPVEIFREDSQLKPDVATQIVAKLIEKDNVSIITGITFSNIMMAVHKPITEKGVRVGDQWLFASFEGFVHPIDVSGETLKFPDTWTLARVRDWHRRALAIMPSGSGIVLDAEIFR